MFLHSSAIILQTSQCMHIEVIVSCVSSMRIQYEHMGPMQLTHVTLNSSCVTYKFVNLPQWQIWICLLVMQVSCVKLQMLVVTLFENIHLDMCLVAIKSWGDNHWRHALYLFLSATNITKIKLTSQLRFKQIWHMICLTLDIYLTKIFASWIYAYCKLRQFIYREKKVSI